MLKTFMKEEKKLLKGLKTKYFHFIMMKSMKNKGHLKEKKKKKKEEEWKRKKKNKKKNKKKTNFSNILKINQKVSAMICLESILILKHLPSWQKNYLK